MFDSSGSADWWNVFDGAGSVWADCTNTNGNLYLVTVYGCEVIRLSAGVAGLAFRWASFSRRVAWESAVAAIWVVVLLGRDLGAATLVGVVPMLGSELVDAVGGLV